MSHTEIQYRTRAFRIAQKHKLFAYCDGLCARSCNLNNAVRFRQRQVYTSVRKTPEQITKSEQEVRDEISVMLSQTDDQFTAPTSENPYMSYEFLDKLLRITDNPDFFADGLPKQTAQQVIKNCVRDMTSYRKALREWKKNPAKFTAKPELPGYAKKKGRVTCTITNQDAILRELDGEWTLKLPLTKQRLDCGAVVPGAILKEVKIIPDNGTYVVSLVLQETTTVQKPEVSDRIAAIDIGVENLMAVTNNCGLPCLLYKGGIVKSCNQYYNKRMAKIMAVEMTKPDCPKGKDGKPKFFPTNESCRITIHRNDTIHDFMHKTAKHFINWCVDNRIDTIVVGVNKQFKQEVELGRVNNQNFVQIPYYYLRSVLHYLADRNGICYIEQEESYTSKASFPDRDFIPVYGQEPDEFSFSGNADRHTTKVCIRQTDSADYTVPLTERSSTPT